MAETHHLEVSRLFDVRGYVCVVTGGGTGIGLMCSQALAANGARVYITSRRQEALERAAQSHSPDDKGGEIIPLPACDVRSKADLELTVEEIRRRGESHIHLLVCNAGISGAKAEPELGDAEDLKRRLWDNESVEAWQETFETDVTSVYFTTVAFFPLLQAAIQPQGPLERFGPSVVTISSVSGLMQHAQGHFSYNAAKGATVHLTKLMSAEFQKTGMRVNSICYVNGEIIAVDGGVLNVIAGR